MSIYNKTIELSITIISLISLVFNILFPQPVSAKESIQAKAMTFNLLALRDTSPILAVKNNISPDDSAIIKSISVENKKNIKIAMLPFVVQPEPIKKMETLPEIKNKIQLVLVEVEPGQTNDEIAAEICKEEGIADDLPCWQDLKAMRIKESYDGKQMTGDAGRSRGWYHIQIKMHKITDVCALDFKCSTRWTVKNLIAHNYKTNRFYAISRHNGGGKMAQSYAKSVVYNSARFKK